MNFVSKKTAVNYCNNNSSAHLPLLFIININLVSFRKAKFDADKDKRQSGGGYVPSNG